MSKTDFSNVPFLHSCRKVRGHVSPGFFHPPDFIIQFRISRPFLRHSFVHSSLFPFSLYLIVHPLRFKIFHFAPSSVFPLPPTPETCPNGLVVNSANKKMKGQTIRKKLRYYIDVPIPSIYQNAVFLIATKWQSTKEDPRMNFKCRIIGFLIFTQKNSGEDLFEIVSIDFLNLKGFLKDSNFHASSKSICTFSPNTENIREEKNKVIHSSPLSVQKLTKERKSAQFHFELFRWTPTFFGKQPSGDPNGVKRKKGKREREKKKITVSFGQINS